MSKRDLNLNIDIDAQKQAPSVIGEMQEEIKRIREKIDSLTGALEVANDNIKGVADDLERLGKIVEALSKRVKKDS